MDTALRMTAIGSAFFGSTRSVAIISGGRKRHSRACIFMASNSSAVGRRLFHSKISDLFEMAVLRQVADVVAAVFEDACRPVHKANAAVGNHYSGQASAFAGSRVRRFCVAHGVLLSV